MDRNSLIKKPIKKYGDGLIQDENSHLNGEENGLRDKNSNYQSS